MVNRRGHALRWVVVAVLVAALAGCDSNITGRIQAEGTGDLLSPPAHRTSLREPLIDACNTAGPVLPSRTSLLDRPPYVQMVSDSAASVVWTSPSREMFRVRITLPDGTVVNEVPSVIEPTDWLTGSSQHIARVEGLEPATLYCYEILSDQAGQVVSPTGFRTAPTASTDPVDGVEPVVRFLAFGDSGWDSEDQWALRDQMLTLSYDLMLITGDVAYQSGTMQQLEEHHFDVYDPILRSIPSYPVAGNHDYETGNGAPLREAYVLPENGAPDGTERWFSFDFGFVHFVGLDTERIGPEQAAWLEQDLQQNQLDWVVVFSHDPPFSAGSHGSNGEMQEFFVPLFEEHGVDLVLSGHDHHYERITPIEGVQYIVTGAGGRGVRELSEAEFTEFGEAVIHMVYVTVEPDEMRLHAIDGTGREFDGAVVPQHL